MTESVDLLIVARWLLPVVPEDTLLENHAVAIRDGKVIGICTNDESIKHYAAKETIILTEHVLMPGLINLHMHAAMVLMRGIADDVALMPWLEQHIWPAEQKYVTPNFVREGTLLACAEMLSGGTTTFNDMYFYPEASIQASLQMGMRASIGLVVLEFSTNYANNAASYIAKGTEVRDQYKTDSLVSFNFSPHAPYTVSDESLIQINMLAEQLDIGIHMHLHETQNEVIQSQQTYGMTPLHRLSKLGLLSARLSLAHCVHMTELEMQLLAEQCCHIAHCPASNLKLASGIAPITKCIEYGINVGLGTDGAASNNRLDMFAEMRLAALLAKGQSGDATAVSAYRAIEMATINGAKALGLESKIGSVEVGKCADLIAVKMSDLNLQPCYDPVSHIVYVASRENVSHVWVNGDLKYYQPQAQQGVFNGVEPQELSDIVQQWQHKMSKH